MADSSVDTASSVATAGLRDLRPAAVPTRERRKQQTAELWERVHAARTEQEREGLREEIVVLNLPVAHAIARRYAARGIPVEDLEQVASVGLVKAVRGFDPALGKDFVSYVAPTVSGEVKRHFRDLGWAVRPPRRVQDLQARITATAADAERENASGSAQRPDDIAARLGVDVSQVIEALTCRGAFAPMSLDAPVGETASSSSLGDLLTSAQDDYAHAENAIVLGRALQQLTPRELLILQLRFWEDRTQQEIGQEIGLSQMQVSRLLSRILESLRSLVGASETELSRSA
jgi:RNA polymerase sigma-B factor